MQLRRSVIREEENKTINLTRHLIPVFKQQVPEKFKKTLWAINSLFFKDACVSNIVAKPFWFILQTTCKPEFSLCSVFLSSGSCILTRSTSVRRLWWRLCTRRRSTPSRLWRVTVLSSSPSTSEPTTHSCSSLRYLHTWYFTSNNFKCIFLVSHLQIYDGFTRFWVPETLCDDQNLDQWCLMAIFLSKMVKCLLE